MSHVLPVGLNVSGADKLLASHAAQPGVLPADLALIRIHCEVGFLYSASVSFDPFFSLETTRGRVLQSLAVLACEATPRV